jgi:L-asparaginase II
VDAVRVEVRRGGVVEAVHRVHCVAVRDGHVVEAAGDAGLRCFMRSSSKPIQALPLSRAREDLDARDLAIASASHAAEPAQIAAVRSLLARAPADEHELECGLQEGRPPERVFHNCSGKHAGMLALCRARGWRSEGYRLPGHRVQREMLVEHAAAAELDEDGIPTATDGCGVVTFAFTLERMAHAFSRFERLDGGARVADAMRAHPELVGAAGKPDTELMRAAEGWIAKGGAEGLLCAAGPGGLGVALKAEDGGYRAIGPALGSFIPRLGVDLDNFGRVSVRNSRGEEVGAIALQD